MRTTRVVAGSALAGGAVAFWRLRERRGRVFFVERSVTVDKPADEVYAFWRAFENVPRFMKRVRSVEPRGEDRWRWAAESPGRGARLEWDAELTEDRPGELLAWRAPAEQTVELWGRVAFESASGGRGTQVRLRLAGASLTDVLGAPVERQVTEDLRRFKRLLETGEIATVEGQPTGKRSPLGKVLVGRRERSAA